MNQLIKIGLYGDSPGKGNGKVSRGKDIPACFGKAIAIDVVHIIGDRSSDFTFTNQYIHTKRTTSLGQTPTLVDGSMKPCGDDRISVYVRQCEVTGTSYGWVGITISLLLIISVNCFR
jgi:hypothetical protein